MYRLRVLGGFALDGPAAAPTFPVPQRLAEAVLAVLAVTGDLGCSRERLMALLWPEADEPRSRAALRSTLHIIRKALGPRAILSAGDLLRLDPAVVGSDVEAFTAALRADRPAEAVRRYGGSLLDGFHLDGAPEFERWLDSERTRLARECLEALARLATAAEHDAQWGEAAGWWARAEEQDPLNSHFALRHAQALAAIGDRANAIKLAEAHVSRLRAELEIEPDRELLEGIDAIRRGELNGAPTGWSRPVPRSASGGSPEGAVSPAPAGSVDAAPTRTRGRGPALSALGVVAVAVAVVVFAIRPGDHKPVGPPLDSTAIAVLPFQVVGADSASVARTLARMMGFLFEMKVTGRFGWRIRHPGSVAERWRAAGGSPDSELSAEAELAVARGVGAGRLVRGTVIVHGDSLVISASMVNVATGAILVRPVRAEGPAARSQELVDRVIVQLLVGDGAAPDVATQLVRYDPEAVQAYLQGGAAPFAEQRRWYHAALAADSGLVDAALMIYAVGENVRDTAELRYAWEHRDRLSERNRAYVEVLGAGRVGPIRTEAAKLAGYAALARRWPEWRGPWGELGDQLTNFGALASVPDWRLRAEDAFERVDRRLDWVRWHLAELAFLGGDVRRIRAAVDSLARSVNPPGLVAAYRWRLAILQGDTTASARILASQPLDVDKVLQFALADGRGVAQADRVAAGSPSLAAMWAWARGHEQAWREAWRRYGSPAGGISEATAPVFWALLLGPAEDLRAAGAVRALERTAARTQGAGADDQALARCWIALWRLERRDTTGARATRRWLEADVDRASRFAGWARLIDVLLAEADGGDVRAALLRMDSVMRELPLPTGRFQWDPVPAEVQNLILARMLRRYGEPGLALAAARRRIYRAVADYPDALPEYLREEGRAAALVGDTAGALHAYRHYLALRENPDPPWRAAWDSVRTDYAALTRH